jgi:hypothetical protein
MKYKIVKNIALNRIWYDIYQKYSWFPFWFFVTPCTSRSMAEKLIEDISNDD